MIFVIIAMTNLIVSKCMSWMPQVTTAYKDAAMASLADQIEALNRARGRNTKALQDSHERPSDCQCRTMWRSCLERHPRFTSKRILLEARGVLP